MGTTRTREALARENEELRARLREAEEVLRAIRNGEVDALVVSSVCGEQVYTLESAERPYRILVEHMPEGAVTLSSSDLILYCNLRFAEMLAVPHERLVSTPIGQWIPDDRLGVLEALLQDGRQRVSQAEVRLRATDGTLVPVMITATPLPPGVEGDVCLIVVDLTEQKRGQEIVAAERLARSILDNAAEAIVVCDTDGRVIRASQAAHLLCGQNPLRRRFGDAFPLECAPDCAPECPSPAGVAAYVLASALAGETATGVEATLCSDRRDPAHLLIAAGPVRGHDRSIMGCVLTLTNVTAYKQAESELRTQQADIELLNAHLRRAMTETHHRVKNNLQVIAALLDVQLMKDVETVSAGELRRLGQHVRSLAAVHDLLTSQSKSERATDVIRTKVMLSKLMPLLEQMLAGQKLVIRAEDIALPSRQGTALAMLLNELVANAAKHGSGDIEAVLAVEGGLARLEVCDSGPGFPSGFDSRSAANTGLEIVESAGCWDLQGEVRYENRPEGGACVVVTFPVGQ